MIVATSGNSHSEILKTLFASRSLSTFNLFNNII